MTTAELPYKTFVFCLAIICLIFTALLLIWPNIFIAINRMTKKWISTDKLEEQINRTHDIDDKLLGMRKVLGFIMLALSAVFVFILFWR